MHIENLIRQKVRKHFSRGAAQISVGLERRQQSLPANKKEVCIATVRSRTPENQPYVNNNGSDKSIYSDQGILICNTRID